VERLTGRPQEDGYCNAEMQRGIDLEPVAFAAYEAATGCVVRRTGFLQHPELMAGCSLDGDIDDFAGVLELKCPKSATHLRYLRGGIVPPDHLPQIVHNLWITGAQWADFVSFDDRFPPELHTFRVRVPRDEAHIASYELQVRQFLREVDAEIADLRGRLAVA
jgi:hypothetical protein